MPLFDIQYYLTRDITGAPSDILPFSNLKVKYNDVTSGTTISCQRYMMEGTAPSTHDLLDGTIDNAGSSTESRPPNIYTNYIIKF